MTTRRNFIKTSAISAVGISLAASGIVAGNVLGANDKIRVGIVGFSKRAKHSLIPALLKFTGSMNFEIVAVSDIWNRRRDEGVGFIEAKTGKKVAACRNNEELYEKHKPDTVIISTPDFQHALHAKQAVLANCDAYVEKPFAEIMTDNREALETIKNSGKIIQIGSQRRSGSNYHAAEQFIKSGKFGDITMVEMCWNVNQPGRWRLPDLVSSIKKSDTDWQRYLMNRPKITWDPRKYCEYRLFWPFSSGIPGQWMSHQIDTVHWFSGYNHPRSVSANGGIYMWNDGRKNYDTMTAVFDYGPNDDQNKGFQVVYSSRMHNSAGGVKELYFSNSGTLNLKTNKVTPDGGLTAHHAEAMNMDANLLKEFSLDNEAVAAETDANTKVDNMTEAHVLNWMECVRNRKTPNAGIWAGYHHSIANIMTTAALRTGKKVTFDEENQEVMAGDEVFVM